ncbi:hypothetical protein WDU94_012377, partial [Cyamophila willieti]
RGPKHLRICCFSSENIADCDFNVKCKCKQSVPISDTFLRAQFIRGLKDNWIREQILQSSATTFDEILTKATALEASRIESQELTGACSSSSNFNSTEKQRKFCNSKSKTRYIDYKSLGLDNHCLRCGRQNHKSTDCRMDKNSLKCNLCNRTGHVSTVCLSSLMQNSKKSNSTHSMQTLQTYESNSSLPTYGMNQIEPVFQNQNSEIIDLFEFNSESDKYMIHVLLNNKQQKFEVDSGAKYSLLSEREFKKLNLNTPLIESNLAFRSYTGNVINSKGKVLIQVQYKDQTMMGELHIVPDGHDPLLGRQWIRGLNIELGKIEPHIENRCPMPPLHQVQSVDDIFQRFPKVFEEKIGCVPNFQVSLQLRKDAKPVFTKERPVPYALHEKVEKELDQLEAQGIITPVAASDWGSPLVCIPKPDGGVRICVDYKCGVNERLVQANHPIRRIDDVLHSLRDSKFFCKLDLFKAYLHLQVDTESSKIQTLSTHRGTYLMNRLSFGVKTAPSEFNRILCLVLKGLVKVEAYFDDIIIHGQTIEECTKNLCACLERLTEYDLHVNKSKCFFFLEKIEYLGHIIEFNKISKSPEKVSAVQNMPKPSNADEVRRFLGLVTYYSRFIPDFSTLSYPLRCLLKKNHQWCWTAQCEAAFLNLKSVLCSDKVLMPFNPSLPVVLTTDASPYGVAAVLSHCIENVEHPIAYASRSLTSSEQNYSQLDREALAIIFGVTHFYNYLYGKRFVLITDNQPLSRIFHHNKALPQMTSARLLRYASFLSGFDYTVQFKKGKENQNVDCLSRIPIDTHLCSSDQYIGDEVNQLYAELILQVSSAKVTSESIKEETQKDDKLKQLIFELKNNSNESTYTLVDDVLFYKDRVVIPVSLQSQILSELHETHLGVMKMKQLARRYVYWTNIDRDIERLVRGCETCAQIKSSPPKVSVHPWECPQGNWERIHIDYAGPFQNAYFLVCVDAKSKWVEVNILKTAPTSTNTIHLLENIFTTHGYPTVIVSDNHSIFQSEEFRTYCTTQGIFQKFIAPGHPATNGLAERNIQTLKNRLKALASDPTPLQEKVQSILLRYRATPLACGKSPAELYLHRKIKIRLDAIFPYHPQASKEQSNPTRFLHVGERVQARFFINNSPVWQFGKIEKKLGSRHYLVRLDSGRLIKRHINQLRSSLVPTKKKVSFQVPRIPSPQIQTPVRFFQMQSPARSQLQTPVRPESQTPERSPGPS